MSLLESKKTSFLFILFFYVQFSAFSQVQDSLLLSIPKATLDSIVKNYLALKKQDSLAIKKDSIPKKEKYWTFKSTPGIVITQTSFYNWTKGGNNTIAGIFSFDGDYHYQKGQLFWKNDVLLRYGITKEENINTNQKTDDVIDLKSSVGYKTFTISKWYYSGDFNLTTQFAKGVDASDTETVISKFFAPARLRIGVGASYKDDEKNLKLNLSPITNQTTFVFDKTLANSGAYGVDAAILDENEEIITPGKNVNVELGALIKIEYGDLIAENISYSIVSSFYTDYLDDFGNIDTDIEFNLNMKVNKHVQAKFNSHLVYDDDATILQEDGSLSGPRAQLKQILGISFSYDF